MRIFCPKIQLQILKILDTKIYSFDWKGKVILVVEDDVSNFRYFDYLLKEVNASVVWVKNGLDAIEMCCSADQHIDLVLMDVLIPFVNGADATKEIRKYKPDLPVVAISAYDTFENRENCFLAGCNEFLSKPVLPEKLLETLACYMEPVKETRSPAKVKTPVEKPKPYKG
jgi:CheY-like chemotaxis protein